MSNLYLQGVDVDEFRQQIVNEVITALGPLVAKDQSPRLVNRERMAELASISVPTLDRLVSEGVVPSKLVGSRRLFNPVAVIDALPDA